jgi:phosphoglycolate phosphatase
LDGTLTDPAEGITNSVAYALEKFGVKEADKTKLHKFIGPPLWESFGMFYNFTKEQTEEAVEYYREYFRDRGIFENFVYNGIPELLKELKASGKKLLVATSKPEVFAVQILKHFNIYEYFDFAAGATMDDSRTKKADVIQYAINSLNITELDKAIMIGDREHDIIGAKKNGIDSIGVLYGYGDREELENAGADYIAETVENIRACIEGEIKK